MTALVGVLGATGMLIAARKTIDSVARIPDVAAGLSPPGSGIENFLLVGSDSRAGIDPNAPDVGGTGTEADVSGHRSDTIMILRRDRSTGEAALLSIPRDLWVQVPGHDGKRRINSAFNDGPEVLVQTLQGALGLPIHHYVEIDFVGFKSLVDALGGVQVCVDYATRDVSTGLDITEPGCHVLDGVQALAYAAQPPLRGVSRGQVARGSGQRPRPHEAPATVRQSGPADGARSDQGRSVRGRPTDHVDRFIAAYR